MKTKNVFYNMNLLTFAAVTEIFQFPSTGWEERRNSFLTTPRLRKHTDISFTKNRYKEGRQSVLNCALRYHNCKLILWSLRKTKDHKMWKQFVQTWLARNINPVNHFVTNRILSTGSTVQIVGKIYYRTKNMINLFNSPSRKNIGHATAKLY